MKLRLMLLVLVVGCGATKASPHGAANSPQDETLQNEKKSAVSNAVEMKPVETKPSEWSFPDALPPGAVGRFGTKAFTTTGDRIAVSDEGRVATSYQGLGLVEFRPDGARRTIPGIGGFDTGFYDSNGTLTVVTSNTLYRIGASGDVSSLKLPCDNYGKRTTFSPNKKLMACIHERNTPRAVHVFEVGQSVPRRSIKTTDGSYDEQLTLTNDGELAVVSEDYSLSVFDKTGKLSWRKVDEKRWFQNARFDEKQSEWLVQRRADTEFVRFDRTGKELKPRLEPGPKSNLVSGHSFEIVGDVLAFPIFRNDDQSVGAFWSGDRKLEFSSDNYIFDFDISPNGTFGAFVDRVGTMVLVDLTEGKEVTRGTTPKWINNMRAFANGDKLLVANEAGLVTVVDTKTFQSIGTFMFKDPISSVIEMSFDDKEELVAVTTRYGDFTLYEVATLQEKCSRQDVPAAELFQHDGKWIGIGGGFDDWMFSATLSVVNENCEIVHRVEHAGGIFALSAPKSRRFKVEFDNATYQRHADRFQTIEINLETGKQKKIGKWKPTSEYNYTPEEIRKREGVSSWDRYAPRTRTVLFEYEHLDNGDTKQSIVVANLESGKDIGRIDLPGSTVGLTASSDSWIAVVDQSTILFYPQPK